MACIIFCSLGASLLMSACGRERLTSVEKPSDTTANTATGTTAATTPQSLAINITVGTRHFAATLADNATGRAFRALLPLSLGMTELNGNEKYCSLSQSLPAAPITPDSIHSGELMRYGTSTVVLFYKTFQTDYRYSPIGRIDAPEGLAVALGPDDGRGAVQRPTNNVNY